ncbi:DUF29 domain-containing protein [Romeria aff. gracilis LEGE 07310]|uniref:DUF29 domain-containing protein n=1 Tax=Vasconcelosia minhoensis LEGE 07310 TaxID=915328 RepID=A0A8J7AVQ3_9CYAN|nr:DUF29 domain-containing protein [Romeria gracilis]MBE9077883.1 DUF29 domain-containing protein [Romeria aff. gracilis LEGE 07310]
MISSQVRQRQLAELYERDFCQWAEQTAQQLRDGNFSDLDLANLIEEMEDMSRSQKRALLSNLRVLLLHLLKLQHQPEKRSSSWRSIIIEHRIRIQDAFEESPSLKPYLQSSFNKTYQKARKQAAAETELPITTFPEQPNFTMEDALNDEFIPN